MSDKYKPGAGVDVGTSNIVVARQKEDGTFENRYHRNMLYALDVSDEATDLLESSNYLYVKVGDIFYVVGDDALKLVNAIGSGEVIRPMKDGILNPTLQESSELLFYIIKAVVGEPIKENESLRYSIPANPIDVDNDNVFHKMLLESFFKKLGFNPKPVNEAMCIAYDCNPVMKTEDGDVALSGICVSAGAGMTNVALSFKGLELNSFSVTKSGDYIDERVALATGINKNQIVRIKEKKLDLNNVDMSDRAISALSIYYDEVIHRVLSQIASKFKDSKSQMEGEIEIIVAGGTSMPEGYGQRFKKCLSDIDLPFTVYGVRQSKTPFYSVSQGACIRAQADHAKAAK